MKRFTYHDYENAIRDLDAVNKHLALFRSYFKGCNKILDIGCGEGLFLKHLKEEDIEGVGIEYDPDIARDVQGKGFRVYTGSVVNIWPQLNETFDGAFCSHLIEHLPFENVIDLVEGLSTKIKPRAKVVFAWPNPGSLEMQLFHFWRDPEHVRYYDQYLIAGLFEHYGLKIDECYSQGPWGLDKASKYPLPYSKKVSNTLSSTSTKKKRPMAFKQYLKKVLGIERLSKEANYIEYLRSQGRELVLVATKL